MFECPNALSAFDGFKLTSGIYFLAGKLVMTTLNFFQKLFQQLHPKTLFEIWLNA